MLSIVAVAVAAVHIAITSATLQGLPHRSISATDDHPFRLVVPGEKRGARWIRQITAIDVEDAPEL